MKTDTQLIEAFYQRRTLAKGEKAYDVTYSDSHGQWWTKYFYATSLEDAKVVAREYMARIHSGNIISALLVKRTKA